MFRPIATVNASMVRQPRRRPRRPASLDAPTFERLESRVLLAVNAVQDGTTLTLTGTDDAEVIEVLPGSTGGQVIVRAPGVNPGAADPNTDTFDNIANITIIAAG